MISEKLLKGTFRGQSFNFRSLSRSGGRKNVFHEFVNDDAVLGQDLGRSPNRYPMTIIIHGEGEEYFRKRDAMIEALEAEGAGTLIHPTYGVLNVMLEGGYSASENITSMGKIDITVTFIKVSNVAKSTTPVFSLSSLFGNKKSFTPEDDGDVEGQVKDLTKKNSDKAKEIIVDNTFADYIKSGQVVLNAVSTTADLFKEGANFISGEGNFSTFLKSVNDFSELGLLDIPEISEGLISNFEDLDFYIDDVNNQYTSFTSFFSFYNDEVEESKGKQTTEENVQTLRNQVAFRNATQAVAVSYASQAFIAIEFSTDEEIDEKLNIIVDQINSMNQDDFARSDLYANLQALKVAVTKHASNLRANTKKIIEVDVINESLTTLVYRYYGDLENYDLILDLNGFENPCLINGKVKILTNG